MEEGRVEKKQASSNVFGGRSRGLSEGSAEAVTVATNLGKHFIAFDTMVKNAQGSDSKKCNW